MSIAQSYETMEALLDNPKSIPPFLYRFKPNAAPVNRAVATLSMDAERKQMQQAPIPSASPAKPHSSSSRPRVAKSEDEITPEERDNDDAAFIKDMFSQAAGDDGSATEQDAFGEYNPDDED